MDKYEVIILMISIVWGGCIGYMIADWPYRNKLQFCARENNVYRCELVPMPIIGEGAR